jgi:glucokinase
VQAGVVLGARNLRGWQRVPVREILTAGFGAPVTVDNDVNLAAVGERWHGAAAGHDDVIFVAIGTGIGAGILVGGQPHRGQHWAAGEVNALPSSYPALDGDGEAGLEDVASGPAIARRAAARGLSGNGQPLSAEDVFALAASGNVIAAAVIAEAVDALARGVAALVAALDPHVVVIGGGVSRQGDALLGPLRERVAAMVRRPAPIVRSALGVDAQLHGAAFVALRLADESLVALVRGA